MEGDDDDDDHPPIDLSISVITHSEMAIRMGYIDKRFLGNLTE